MNIGDKVTLTPAMRRAAAKADSAATRAAREAEVKADLESYRASKRPPSVGELAEMRAAFGEGATVADVLTGGKTFL